MQHRCFLLFLFRPCFMMVHCNAWRGADQFLWCSTFPDRFFHSVSPGAPLKFANLLWCCRSPLRLRDSTLQVRLFVLSVCLCVCVFWSVMIRLFILELVAVFSILLHSAACLSWMWFCRFHSCRSLPSLIKKFLRDYCFCEFVELIGPISHARFSWETLPHAELWLIAQLSLLFLSDVL